MEHIALLICITMVFSFAILQLALTLGAPLGEYVLGGQYRVLPMKMRLISFTFFCIFIFVGLIYLQRGNIVNIGLSFLFVKVVIIIYTLFLAYAIIGNGVLTKSKKEKFIMTPLSIIGFICSVAVLFLA